nr:PREDICTED: uncharacterized protein LOC108198305 [Daucus carota subsp. sativus]
MSTNDRSWMNRRLESNRITLTPEYKLGVEQFIKFAIENKGVVEDLMKCPCVNCKNGTWETIENVRYHLIANGICLGYKIWTSHGESSRRKNNRVQREVEKPVDMEAMLRDVGAEPKACTSRVEEPPNADASEFYKEVNRCGTPIYPGNTNYTKLSFTTRLLHFKNESHCSEKSFNLLLEIIGDVLPPKHTLPSTYYEVKKIVKELKLSYNKIDACENNCMLFYGDDKDKKDCDHCGKSRYKEACGKKSTTIPRKILRHFPLIDRLKRLFMSEHTAKQMTWYKNREVKEGEISHPSDGDDWKNFDLQHPSFAKEFRNVRLGLSTDGFNPFDNSGNKVYSLWPVVVVVYNLPPSMSMKKPYMFLTLIIPGPDNTKKDLHVFLRPLIDELKILWHSGVETFDQSQKNNFHMRAALMWTISDFPALAQLKGWSTKGKCGCLVCLGSVKGFQLKNCGKPCWYGTNRIFLNENDSLRKKGPKFASTERAVFRGRMSGEYEISTFNHLQFPPPGRLTKQRALGYGKEHNWTSRPIFYELEYWSSLRLRHCIDVMHTEKNVFENVFYTIVDDRFKSKDHNKSRMDCKELGVMSGLWLNNGVKPKARFTLTRPQLRQLCEWVSSLDLPDGCCSNLARCVKMDVLKFHGLKSHDCHIFMQKLMSIAFREFLPRDILDALAALSNYFVDICSTILVRSDLELLEKSIVKTLCVLETIFPPSFFDIMEHLVLHLAEECRLGGPVHYRWMYPFERLLKFMKDKIKNKARVEGSIAEKYVEEETVNFCSYYFKSNVGTVHNTVGRNEVAVEKQDDSILEVFRYPIECLGKHVVRYLDDDEYFIAEYYVLLNMPEVQPYIREYASYTGATPEELESLLKTNFKIWFKKKIENDVAIYPRFKDLLNGPSRMIMTFQSCKVNGYKFRCKDKSGVLVKEFDSKIMIMMKLMTMMKMKTMKSLMRKIKKMKKK